MHLLLFGATGMTGNEVLHLALADPRSVKVTTIGRRPNWTSRGGLPNGPV